MNLNELKEKIDSIYERTSKTERIVSEVVMIHEDNSDEVFEIQTINYGRITPVDELGFNIEDATNPCVIIQFDADPCDVEIEL